MINASNEFRALVSDNSKVQVRADLRFTDGSAIELTGDDFMLGGIELSEATSSTGSFDIGAAIMGSCALTLNNYDERFSSYDFTDATVTPYIGVELSNGRVEWIRRGLFHVEQPDSYPSTVRLSCLDNLSLLETPYSEVTTRYPATLRTIVSDICAKHSLSTAKATFPNSDYVVPTRPDDEALTCLEVLSYAAQAAGCFARCDTAGCIDISWYDLTAFEGEDWLDGMEFDPATPYATGSVADGGGFTSYVQGAKAEGGSFDQRSYAVVHAIASATICTDDVVITGVRVTEGDSEGEDGAIVAGETRLYGSEGYVLCIEGNPLIPYGKAVEVAAKVGPRIVGMRFRPFDASVIGDPTIEAGDPVIVIDARQRTYIAYLTAVTYKAGSYQSLACSAKTPARNRATGYTAASKAIVELRKEIERERSARDLAIQKMADKLGANNGMYVTTEEGSSGGTVCYIHDKPTLAESQVVWKMTVDAIAISNDGGKAYPYGLTADGDAILERIYAIGLDADYITTGALTVRKGGTTVFSADVDTGDVYINGSSVTIGAQSLPSALLTAGPRYCSCTTAASTKEKYIGYFDHDIVDGMIFVVTFANKDSSQAPLIQLRRRTSSGIVSYVTYEIHRDGAVLNPSDLASVINWRAGDTLTFVKNGTAFDIVASSDYTTASELKVTKDSISMKVSKGDVSSQLSIESGKVHIDSDRFSWDSTNSTLADDGTITSKASGGDLTVSGGHLTFNKHGKPDEVTGVLQMENNGGAMRLLCKDGVLQLSGKEIQLYPTGRLSVNGQLGYTGNVFVDGKNLYFYKGILTTVDGNVSAT